MRPDILILFNREYWLDEWHTMLVANRPSATQVISDLHAGSDFAPPFVHLALWTLGALAGGELQPWMARLFMLACTAAAVAFTYHALRRSFARAAAWTGALAVATHAMVISYAFEARFYAPWLLFAAMFAWSLGITRAPRRLAFGAVAAVGLCTSHWFGVISLGLMCGGAFLCHPEQSGSHPERREGSALHIRANRIAPALAGVVALLVCIPLLFGQRASIREGSWVPSLSWSQFAHLADTFWLALIPLLAIAIIALAWAVRTHRERVRPGLQWLARDPSLAALLALVAMPLALTLLSLLQPVMLDRYALTAVLAWAPLAAIAAHALPRAAGYAAVGVLAVAGLVGLGAQIGIERQVQARVASERAVLRQGCARGPVVFTTRLQMYYHLDFIRQQCPAASYLAIANNKLDRLYRGPNEFARRQFRTENEFAALHDHLYGFPTVRSSASLDSLAHFVVMAEPSTIPRDATGRELFSPIMFPTYRVTELSGNGLLYERR